MPLYIDTDTDTQHKACKVSVLTAMSLHSIKDMKLCHTAVSKHSCLSWEGSTNLIIIGSNNLPLPGEVCTCDMC